jgi:hypothetical protein
MKNDFNAGMLAKQIPWCVLLLCACVPTEDQLRTRAAFDMQCPGDQLQVVALDAQIRGVSGCGQRRTYVTVCNGQPGYLGTTCNWVADSAGQGGPPPQGSPPPGSPPQASYAPPPGSTPPPGHEQPGSPVPAAQTAAPPLASAPAPALALSATTASPPNRRP